MPYMAKVIHQFVDKATGKVYEPGATYVAETLERLEELALIDPPRVEFDAKVYEAKVVCQFLDKYTRHIYRVGSTYRTNSLDRIHELASLDPPRVALPNGAEPLGDPDPPGDAPGPGVIEAQGAERPDGAVPEEQIDGQGPQPAKEARPLEELSYAELQALARERGIKANQGREKLIAALKSE